MLAVGLFDIDQESLAAGRLSARLAQPERSLSAKAKSRAAASKRGSHSRAKSYGQIPLNFIENAGQFAKDYRFLLRGNKSRIYFAPRGLSYVLNRSDPEKRRNWRPGKNSLQSPKGMKHIPSPTAQWVVHVEFVGADPLATLVADQKTEAIVSYFKGQRSNWKTGLSSYRRLTYRNLWPGIDLVYTAHVGHLKYDFIVHPGADPRQIRLRYQGANGLEIDRQGALQVETALGTITDHAPVSYQGEGNDRSLVPSAYQLRKVGHDEIGRRQSIDVSFQVGDYNRRLPLVIDPLVVQYGSFLGGVNGDHLWSVAADDAGNAYVAGATQSDEVSFPAQGGPSITSGGSADAVICKLNADGSALAYCGFIGGGGGDEAYGVAVDSSGNAYVGGITWSSESDFPVTVGPSLVHPGGGQSGFICKVNTTGTALDYCGYVGGNGWEVLEAVAVDNSGNAYVTGETQSSAGNFPVKVGPSLIHSGGGEDAFICKVNAAGTALTYCGYIGVSGGDVGKGVAVDSAGNAYVVGHTDSTESTFPITLGPDLSHNGSTDGFVCKVNSTGSALTYCGYLGGSSSDRAEGVAVDVAGNAYVAGYTSSTEASFPVTVGPDVTHNGNSDAFICKVSAAGTALDYCGYVGGSEIDGARNVAVDSSGNAHLAGYTNSTESSFPVIGGPDLTQNGSYDAFVCVLNATGSALTECGFIGGGDVEVAKGIALDGAGGIYLAGDSESTQNIFQTAAGFDASHNGDADGFILKLTLCGNGFVEAGEDCDPGAADANDCCSTKCQFVVADTICRAAGGTCDAPEVCDGTSALCPTSDAMLPKGTECRAAAANSCDVAEECDGLVASCPQDSYATVGTECRAAANECDVAETCSGLSPDCGGDSFLKDGTACTDDGLACNGSAVCNAGSCDQIPASFGCDDQNLCTADGCVEPTGCVNLKIEDCCNNVLDCDDDNACTKDTCSGLGGTCSHEQTEPLCCAADAHCDDGDVCTKDTCHLGNQRCQVEPIAGCCKKTADCDDGDKCTVDSCDTEDQQCATVAIAGCCHSREDCNDEDPCTTDTCSESQCTHTVQRYCRSGDGGVDAGPISPPDSGCNIGARGMTSSHWGAYFLLVLFLLRRRRASGIIS